MDTKDNLLELLLTQALEYRDKSEREEWLQRVLGNAPEKLKELKELIEHHESGKWLDAPPKAVLASRKLIEDLTGKKIGPFLIVRKIGEGGMGDVYLAQQQEPVRRQVALKLIQWDAEPQQVVERFQREKQMLASMEHPNIARIIDAGTTDLGYSYIVMEFVNGSHLIDYCCLKNPDIQSRVKLLLQCCRAIQHAHQKGIIHRDIKPNNVMVTEVDGEPTIKIIDFGIAKASMNDSIKKSNEYTSSIVNLLTNSLTYRGNSPGTPPYMSPEQFSNRSSDIDTRSDVYSLGAVLYYLLTQQHPFSEEQLAVRDFTEIGELVSKNDPPLPSQRNPKLAKILRGDLDSIVRKAMCRDVEQRYQSVAQLGEDLQRYLRGDTVSTNPDSPWTQFRKLTKRYQLLVATAALAFAATSIAWFFAESQNRNLIVAKTSEIQNSTVANLLAASSALQRQEYALANQTLEAIPGSSTRLDARLLRSQIPKTPSQVAKVEGKIYYGLAIDSILSIPAIVCGTNRSKLHAFDQTTGNLLFEIDTNQKEINGLALRPDGKTIATAGDDGTVKFWDLETKMLLNQFVASKKSVYQIAWSKDGQSIITAASEPNAKIWSYPQFQLIREIGSLDTDLECVASSNTNIFAFGDCTGRIRLGDFSVIANNENPSEDEEVRSQFYKYSNCSCISFSPSGNLAAIGLNNGYLLLARIKQGDLQVLEQIRFASDVTAVAFSKNEKQLAIGEKKGAIHVLDLKESWPENSRVAFTPFFFQQHPEYFQGTDETQRELRLKDLISHTEPNDALEKLEQTCDRVVIHFKEPLKIFLYQNEFVREWFDSAGDTAKTHSELPIDVIPKDNSVELRFRTRGSIWTDPNSLRLEERLETWDVRSKRISSVAWGNDQSEVFGFSEDSTVSKLFTSTSRSDVLMTEAEEMHSLTSDQLYLRNSSGKKFRLVQMGHSGLKGSQIEPLDIISSPHINNWSDGRSFFLTYLDHHDNLEPHWAVDQWRPRKARESKVVVFPENLKPDVFICQNNESQWICRFANWNKDRSFIQGAPTFLGLWDETINDFVWKHEPNKSAFRHSRISNDRTLLVYENDGNVYRVNLKTGIEDLFLEKPGESVSGLRFSQDGQVLAIALNNELVIRGYSVNDAKLLWEIPLHGGPIIKDFYWSKDQSVLVTLSMDRNLRTYDVALRRITTQIPLSIQEPKKLEIPLDEKAIFVLDTKGKIVRLPCLLESGN